MSHSYVIPSPGVSHCLGSIYLCVLLCVGWFSVFFHRGFVTLFFVLLFTLVLVLDFAHVCSRCCVLLLLLSSCLFLFSACLCLLLFHPGSSPFCCCSALSCFVLFYYIVSCFPVLVYCSVYFLFCVNKSKLISTSCYTAASNCYKNDFLN